MEASEAQATEAQTAPQEGQEGQEGQEPGIGQVLERFNEFDKSFGDRMDRVEQMLPEAEPGQGEGDLGLEPEQGDGPQYYENTETGEIVDQYGRPVNPEDLDRQEQQRAMDQLQQRFDQKMQQEIAPLKEWIADRQAGDLESKYPKLADQQYAEQVLDAAEDLSGRLGDPGLAQKPGFLELVHLAREARERAAQETPAGAPEQGVALEQPGAAQPGTPEQDPGDAIVNVSANKSKFFD